MLPSKLGFRPTDSICGPEASSSGLKVDLVPPRGELCTRGLLLRLEPTSLSFTRGSTAAAAAIAQALRYEPRPPRGEFADLHSPAELK